MARIDDRWRSHQNGDAQFDHAGQGDVMLTPQIAGNAKRQLGEPVADLTACRDEIIAALDWLFMRI